MTKGRLSKDHKLTHEQHVQLVKDLKDKGYSNSAIANIARLSESIVRTWLKPEDRED